MKQEKDDLIDKIVDIIIKNEILEKILRFFIYIYGNKKAYYIYTIIIFICSFGFTALFLLGDIYSWLFFKSKIVLIMGSIIFSFSYVLVIFHLYSFSKRNINIFRIFLLAYLLFSIIIFLKKYQIL